MRFRIYDIEPMGAVRTTQRGKWKDAAANRYANYKKYVGLKVRQHAVVDGPSRAAIGIKSITFYMPIPKSGYTSYIGDDGKRKRRKVNPGDFHTSKPDIDNLIKGVFDALNGIVWVDDGQVCHIGEQKKIYSHEPGIELEVIELF